jgi:ELWxxDGT repeat protein
MKLIVFTLLFILFGCGKKLPDTQIRSLSGMDYNGPNSRINLIHDFNNGTMFLISHSIKVPNGMFFSTLNFNLNAYGSELYYFDNSTGTYELVADIRPGKEASNPSDFSDPGGDWVYFLASTEERGREIHRVHKTTFLVEELPEGVSDDSCDGMYNDSFVMKGNTQKGFVVIQENPIVAYGTGQFETGGACAGSLEKRLVEYTYDGTTATYGAKQITANTQVLNTPVNGGSPQAISASTTGDYIINPTQLTKILAYQSTVENPMVVMRDNVNKLVAVFPNGNTYRYDKQVGTVDKILELENNNGNGTTAAFIATDNISDGPDYNRTNTNYKVWVYSLDANVTVSPLDILYGTTNGYNLDGTNAYNHELGTNIKEILVHDNKLYYTGDLPEINCSGTCSNGDYIGTEVGVYDPWDYHYTNKTGVLTLDFNTNAAGVDTDDSGAAGLVSAGDKVCLSADNGSDGAEIHCIADDTYALSSYDINPGAFPSNPYSLVHLDGNLVFYGAYDAQEFGIFHLNLDSGTSKKVGTPKKLYEDPGGNIYYNRVMNPRLRQVRSLSSLCMTLCEWCNDQ